MTDDAAEKSVIATLLQGIQEYVQMIEAQPLPGGRRLVFMAVAGCRQPDGTTNINLICNAGDEGMADLIVALEKERIRRRSPGVPS